MADRETAAGRTPARRRLAMLALAYLACLGLGVWLAAAVPAWLEAQLGPRAGLAGELALGGVAAVYVAAAAVPFVPGAEIGFGLLLAFGAPLAPLVYLCMLGALCLAYGAGRLVPPEALGRLFLRMGLRRAAGLVAGGAGLAPEARLALIARRAPGRLVPFLLRHRHAALFVALNLPGNALVGGGGGLALLAGMSRLISPVAFVLTAALAVAPVPLAVWALALA